MTLVHVEVGKNIKTAVEKINNTNKISQLLGDFYYKFQKIENVVI